MTRVLDHRACLAQVAGDWLIWITKRGFGRAAKIANYQ
jgi:hypothetical protein